MAFENLILPGPVPCNAFKEKALSSGQSGVSYLVFPAPQFDTDHALKHLCRRYHL